MKIDHSVFAHTNDIIIAIYVDDLLILDSDSKDI